MTRGKWMVLGLAALLVFGWAYAAAQDAEGRKARRTASERGARGGGMAEATFDYAGVANEMGLSGAQAEKLTGLIVNQFMQARLRRAQLDDDQKVKVKAACAGVAKDVLAATDARGRMTALRSLQQKISQDILRDDQRQRVGRTDRSKGGRPEGAEGRKKGRGKKKAEGGDQNP